VLLGESASDRFCAYALLLGNLFQRCTLSPPASGLIDVNGHDMAKIDAGAMQPPSSGVS